MTADRVTSQSGVERAYTYVRAAIIDGTLAPNTRITETEIGQHLGLSRTPTREALRMLETEGFLERHATGATYVTELTSAQIRQIASLRAVLEGLLAHQASGRLSNRDIQRLEDLSTLMEGGGSRTRFQLGKEFHEIIERAANSPWCSDLLREIRGHIDRSRALAVQDSSRAQTQAAEHRAIVAALKANDAEAAEQAMKAHLEGSARASLRSSLMVDRETTSK